VLVYVLKYRSRTEITAQILETAIGGVTKTKIMYGAFLSFAQLKEYLDTLHENDLLSYDNKSRKFKTTPKGHRFLKITEELGKLAQPVVQEHVRKH
jgi:predicted transcriptional regulator